jgi:hypothetical protein
MGKSRGKRDGGLAQNPKFDRKLEAGRAFRIGFRLKFFPGPGGTAEIIAAFFRVRFNSDIKIRANRGGFPSFRGLAPGLL